MVMPGNQSHDKLLSNPKPNGSSVWDKWLFHFQIKTDFVGFTLPYYLYYLRLAFASFLIWKWN
jgi:hypothetical protein